MDVAEANAMFCHSNQSAKILKEQAHKYIS